MEKQQMEHMPIDELIKKHPKAACACFNLRKAARMVTQLFDVAYRGFGLKSTQLGVLNALNSCGTANVNRLAEILVVDRTTLSRNLVPLEKRGLITVTPGQDQRTRELTLTKAGLEMVKRSAPQWEKVQNKIIQGLGEQRFSRMLKDLDDTIRIVKDEL